MDFCKTTGKYSYDTIIDAENAMRGMSKRKKGKKGAVYQCPHCNKWHLTHYSYAESKSIKQRFKTISTTKIKSNMATKKMGAATGYVDVLGKEISVGDEVRHTISGIYGTVTKYGTVRGEGTTNYRLTNKMFEIARKYDANAQAEILALPMKTDTKNIDAATSKALSEEDSGEIEKQFKEGLARSRPIAVKQHNIEDLSDQALADELRRRGFELTAKKMVEIRL